jgi:ubiquinone/menaquinone biosynthesis C-methylase UbiE
VGRFKHKYQRWQTKLFRAPWFSKVFVETMGSLASPIYEWTLDLMGPDLAHVKQICDVGCGNALMSRYVASTVRGRHFTLVDQSASQLNAGREVIMSIAAHNTVTSYAQPVEALPLPDNSVDVLYTTGSINLWTDPVLGLEQCRRVVRPGGVIWLFDQAPCVTPALALDALFVKRVFGLGIPGYTMDQVLSFAALAGLPKAHQTYPNMSLYGIRWAL